MVKVRKVRIGAIRHAEILQDVRMSGLEKLRAAPDVVVNDRKGPSLIPLGELSGDMLLCHRRQQ